MARWFLFLLLFVFIGKNLYAQKELILIEGYVLSSDSLKPVQNAHIISRIASRGSISDHNGKFTLAVATIDTLLVTSIGFERKFVAIDKHFIENHKRPTILLKKEVSVLKEVIVRPFPDYRTFKEVIVKMDSKPPEHIYLLGKPSNFENVQSRPVSSGGPVQAFYNVFNKTAVRDRRLRRNRKKYNEALIERGRAEEQIPVELIMNR